MQITMIATGRNVRSQRQPPFSGAALAVIALVDGVMPAMNHWS